MRDRPFIRAPRRAWTCVILVLLALGVERLYGQNEVEPYFSPAVTSTDKIVNYVLELPVSRNLAVNIPIVKGLEIGDTPQIRIHYEMVNGQHKPVRTLMWPVRATEEGTFTVPSFMVRSGTDSFRVLPAALKVVPADHILAESVEVEIETADRTVFVGEPMPVKLKVYWQPDLELSAATIKEKQGEAFVQNEVNTAPLQTVERKNAIRWEVTYWNLLLTPVRAGVHGLGYDLVGRIVVRERRSTGFSSFNLQRAALVNIPVEPVEFTVKPLPEADQPENFTGAIGRFDLSARIDNPSVDVGDPITFSLVLRGVGNFDLIEAPRIPETEGLRIYEPKVEFEPEDTLGFTGTKTFQYVVIPESPDATVIPAIPFNYFNPSEEQYVDLSTRPTPIAVESDGRVPDPDVIVSENERKGSRAETGEGAMRPIRLEAEGWVESIRPVFASPVFIAGQAIPLAALAGLIVAGRRRKRLRTDEAYIKRIRAGRRQRIYLKEAKRSSEAEEATHFFDAAFRLIQETVGKHVESRPESLTLDQITRFLESRGASVELVASTTEFFEAAESLKFGSGSPDDYELSEWHETLLELVEELEKVARK